MAGPVPQPMERTPVPDRRRRAIATDPGTNMRALAAQLFVTWSWCRVAMMTVVSPRTARVNRRSSLRSWVAGRGWVAGVIGGCSKWGVRRRGAGSSEGFSRNPEESHPELGFDENWHHVMRGRGQTIQRRARARLKTPGGAVTRDRAPRRAMDRGTSARNGAVAPWRARGGDIAW